MAFATAPPAVIIAGSPPPCGEEARDLVSFYSPGVTEKVQQQIEAYKRMPDSVLFRVQKVQTSLTEFDLPGPTRKKVFCTKCGQVIRDNREVMVNGLSLCRPCAHGAYFKNAQDINWQDMNWSPLQ